MTPAEMGRKGAKVTAERHGAELSTWGRKGALKQARALGKEGRRLRALKGAATKRANEERYRGDGNPHPERLALAIKYDAGTIGNVRCPVRGCDATIGQPCKPAVETRPMSEAPAVVQAVAKIFEPHKDTGERFREMASRIGPLSVSMLACREAPKAKRPEPRPTSQNGRVLALLRSAPDRRWTSEQLAESLVPCDLEGTRNALSSLRSGGHVVAEPLPGSKRAKVWRLA